jgi:hypothetical protein
MQLSHKGNLNYFLPRELGGLGLDLYPEVQYEVTRFQHQLANFMAREMDNTEGKDISALEARKLRLVQTNAPVVLQPYLGSVSIRFVRKGDPMPEGYSLVNNVEQTLFTDSPSTPLLSYRFISTKFLREFRMKPIYTDKAHYRKYLGSFNRFDFDLVESQPNKDDLVDKIAKYLCDHEPAYARAMVEE